jgi:hypothetical protein
MIIIITIVAFVIVVVVVVVIIIIISTIIIVGLLLHGFLNPVLPCAKPRLASHKGGRREIVAWRHG